MNIIGINGYIGSGKDTVGKIIQYLQVSKDYPSLLQGMSFEEFLEEALGTKAVFYSANEGSIGSEWEIKKYAGKLKQIASILTGIPVEKLEDQEFKKTELGPQWSRWTTLTKDYRFSPTRLTYGELFSTEDEAKKDVLALERMIKRKKIENVTVEAHLKMITVRELIQKLGTEAMRDVIHPNTWVNALFADYRPNLSREDKIRRDFGSKEDINWLKAAETLPKWVITDTRFVNEAQAIKDRGGIVIRVNRDWELRKNGEYIEPDFIPHSSETGLNSWTFDHIIENNSGMDDLVEAVRVILKYYKII